MADPGQIRAAGAVLYRHSDQGDEVGLIHRSRYGDWTFPKGKVEPGEHVLVTAVREVAEETGITVVLGRKLGQIAREVGGRPKRVDYWAGRVAPGGSPPFTPNSEVDELIWLPRDAAQSKLTYQDDVKLLAELTAGPADTVPLILLRHASAGSKATWAGDDLARPLDERGAADAELLAGMLACFGRCRAISSAAERCLATIRPYTQRVGAPVTVEPALTVTPDRADLAAGTALALRVAAQAEPAVLCAHGENLAAIIPAVFDYLGAGPPTGPSLVKGGFWVLHVAGGALAGAEQHRPAVTVDWLTGMGQPGG